MLSAWIVSVVLLLLGGQDAVPRAECRDWADCRDRALEAAARKDYESFHDYAWRVVQTGPRNDPASLFLLARAQSLSGRPLDAIVMLRRVASSGAAQEALTSPDFARVRALPGWPDVEALLKGAPAAGRSEAAPPAGGGVPVTPAPAAAPVAPAGTLLFDAASFKPAAIAYDRVSKRFIIADTDISRLAVIDEFSKHLATLASGQSAGFGTVTALAIDPREGNLWVASVDAGSTPALHKLQLISGRMLKTYSARPAAAGPFVDVAVGQDGSVLAIQESGRVLRLSAGAASLQPVAVIGHGGLASVTMGANGAVYVSGQEGLLRFRPAPAVAVKAGAGIDLKRLTCIRWAGGTIVALQRTADGAFRVTRIHLSADGRTATGVEVLDPLVRISGPAAATVADGVLYYVAETEGAKLAIRRVVLRRP